MIKIFFSLFLISRVIFVLFALLATYFIPLEEGYLGKQHYPEEPYLVWIWSNFDGRHFADIVVSGYRNFNFAFFPLYPLSIKILDHQLLVDPPYVGILLSAVSFLLAMFVVYKIVMLDFKEKIAYLTLLFLSFFPLAFFYHSMYPDSLFLLLSVTSFYFARRGNWLLCGIFGGLTTATRLAGVALIPALAFEWFMQNRKVIVHWGSTILFFLKTGFIALVLTGSGVLIYMIYLQVFFGDFLLFQKAMSAWNQNQVVLLPQVLFRYLKIFWTVQKDLLVFWVALLEFLTFFLYMSLAIYVWKRVRASYGIFMVVLLILVTFTGTLAGTQRYILHMFPAFLGLALLLYKRRHLKLILFLVFLILGFVLTGLFTRGYWIA